MSGHAVVRLIDDQHHILFHSEADLRASLAQVAEIYGWHVEQEVVVPGWGRIDLVLRHEARAKPFLVELKLKLTRPSDVRKAFQQADGYGRWWAKERGEAATALLVAAAPNMGIITPVADAYPAVPFRTITSFMTGLHTWHPSRARLEMVDVWIEHHLEQLTHHRHARALLSQTARRADESAAHAEHAEWLAAGEPSAFPVVDF